MGRWRFALVLLTLAGLLFAGLAAYLRRLERDALAGALLQDQLTAEGRPRPLAEVASALRQSKLVTTEINTRVTSAVEHGSWRGDVQANVSAPVRLLYGCDLSKMTVESLAFSPASRTLLVRIPTPERIATEVRTEEGFDVEVGWMRLRSRSGEYHLGLARRALYERARELTLSREHAAEVRSNTLEQVRDLVRRAVGTDAQVRVTFADGSGA